MEPINTRRAFLAGVSLTYLFAFSSLYYQIPGLYGDDGILPVRNVLACEEISPFECVHKGTPPSLMHLAKLFEIGPSVLMEVFSLVGMLVAALQLVFNPFKDSLFYALLWGLYFSCFQVGQTFLWFQWDTLLLETGFLTILVAPFGLLRGRNFKWLPHDNITMWLVKWLVFRLMFASGVVKLTSECPTWWGLTALSWHFESQCIPTPAAWIFHQLPGWLLRLGVVATYFAELFVPLLFLAPIRSLRVLAFWNQVFFMLCIVATGNYNFFNLLTIVISIPLLMDSRHSSTFSSGVVESRIGGKSFGFGRSLVVLSTLAGMVYYMVRLFNVRFVNGVVETKVGFVKDDLYRELAYAVPLLIILAAMSFISECFAAVIRCFMDFKSRCFVQEFWALFQTFAVIGIASVAFAASIVPFSWLDRGASEMLWPEVKQAHRMLDPYQATHSYGLFRSMTGVGGRPELIVEGSDTEEGPYKEYEFLYKPGALDKIPPFIVPHQARLDWQMWFAALGKYQNNPWFLSLVYRLLKGQKEVLHLMGKNPFLGEPPKFIRANLYLYHFTSKFQGDKRYSNSTWWWREFKSEYLPPVSLQNPSLEKVLTKHNYLVNPKPFEPKTPVTEVLLNLRKQVDKLDGAVFVWSVLGAVVICWWTVGLIF